MTPTRQLLGAALAAALPAASCIDIPSWDEYVWECGLLGPPPNPCADVDTGSPDSGAADTAADPCPADAPAVAGDGCCPAGLAERSDDPDCVLATAEAAVGSTWLSPAVVGPAGHVALLTEEAGDATLAVRAPDLTAAGDLAVGDPVAPLVVLPDGRLALTTAAGVFADPLDDPGAGPETVYDGPAASAPIALDGGSLLVLRPDGAIVRTLPSPTATAPLLPPADRYEVGLSADGETLLAIAEGALDVVDLGDDSIELSVPGTAEAMAVIGSTAVVVTTGDGTLTGAVRASSLWTALPPTPLSGDATPPVVASGGLVLIAYLGQKRLTAVQLAGQTPIVRWELTALPDAPAASPLVLSDGMVALPLSDGTLIVLARSEGNDPPPIAWRYTPGEASLRHPRELPDGTLLLLSTEGDLTLLAHTRGDLEHPWPTLGADPTGSSRARL